MKRSFILFTLMSLAFVGYAGSTFYVNINATGANSGTSWTDAYTSLNQACNKANSGDSIFIAKGIYRPVTGLIFATGPRDKVFLVKPGVQVFGGFTGTENTLAERSNDSTSLHVTNATILSGDLGTPNDSSDNAYHVMFVPSASPTTLIDGITVAYGNADDSSTVGSGSLFIDRNYGGGIYIIDGKLNIRNCIIRDNLAYSGGAGIENRGGGSIEIHHSVLSRNKVWGNNPNRGGGGGLRNDESTSVLFHVIFDGNEARDVMGGGAIRNDSASHIACLPCTFNNNKATNGDGGGAMYNLYSSGTLEFNRFEQNFTNGQGGAIYNDHVVLNIDDSEFTNNEGVNGAGAVESDAGGMGVSFHYCQFIGNHTDANGGALQNWKHSPKIDHCLFENNTAGGDGGALYNYTDCSPKVENTTFRHNHADRNGGAIYNRRNCNPVVTNVLIHGNSAGLDGGGVYTIMSNSAPCSPIFTNTTITGNHANGSGGGAYDEGTGDPKLRNSIIIGNTSNGADDIDAPASLALTAVFHDIIGTDYLASGSSSPIAVTGQVFVDSANGDFRLADGCLAIDLGDSSYFNSGMIPDLSAIDKDLRFSDRIMGPNIDLGAIEVCTDTGNLSIALTVSPNDTIINGTTLQFNVSWTGGGPFPIYVWYVNGQKTSNISLSWNAVMGVDVFDGDSVYVEIISSHGCDNAMTSTSNVIVPRMATGIETYDQPKVSVYPNPTTGTVYLSFSLKQESPVNVTLFDVSGKLIYHSIRQCETGVQKIAVNPEVNAGLYLLQISTPEGIMQTERLIFR